MPGSNPYISAARMVLLDRLIRVFRQSLARNRALGFVAATIFFNPIAICMSIGKVPCDQMPHRLGVAAESVGR